MMGAALSRWTMASFAAALLFLIGAEALMVAGYGFPVADIRAPQTLVLVHMVTIGWLSLLLLGALFQFVPVLVSKPLLHENLVLPSLAALLGGLACLLCGFLHLAAGGGAAAFLLSLAGLLLRGAVRAGAGRAHRLALPARPARREHSGPCGGGLRRLAHPDRDRRQLPAAADVHAGARP
jgi:hypothetical protein